MTQKTLIKQYLASLGSQWVKAYDLRGRQTVFGFLGHQADRRARELANEGAIEHRLRDGFAEYRAVQASVHFPAAREEIKRENPISMNEFIKNFPPARKENVSPKAEAEKGNRLF